MMTKEYTGTDVANTDPRVQHITGDVISHGQHQWIDIPFITEIAPNLWQGGCQDGLVLPSFVSHLLSLYSVERYTIRHKLRTRHDVKMYDSPDQAMDQVDRWARWVNARRNTGPVLVHCQAGLNRSGLITARALMMNGMDADVAIELIRRKRSPMALCNTAFEEYLLSL